MTRRLVAGALFSLCLATAAPASAETAAEVRDLAARADRDPAALDRLKQVRSVDGKPADFERALDGAEGADLSRRLDAIESSAGTVDVPEPAIITDGAQREAQRILEGERYQPDDPPRPLAGVLRRIGEWLEPVLGPIGDAFGAVAGFFGRLLANPWGAIAVALAVVVLVALLVGRFARRSSRLALEAPPGRPGRVDPRALDPKELERQADEAEQAGDFDTALRLRFLAGVVRLDRAGVIELTPSATTGELVRSVRSTTFRPLARAFDEVAYGGRHPGREELERAKSDWPRVLEEARR